MDRKRALDHKLRNLIQSLFLIVGMTLLLALSSRLLLGADFWWLIVITITMAVMMLPHASPYWLLRLYRAKPVHPAQLPQHWHILKELSRRAELPATPDLFWIPSQTLNAFAVGSRQSSAIAITNGLLQVLSDREIAGVLAHEISHIRNHDLRIMTLADLITRTSHLLSVFALLLILFSLPFIISGEVSISLTGLLILSVAPSINALLQLGLSRIREFDADLDAARLTQDPAGLAAALTKIDPQHLNWWHKILLPGYRDRQPSILRSHPDTHERVERLLNLQYKEPAIRPEYLSNGLAHRKNPYPHIIIRKPGRGFFNGNWR
jgi:heat shock protein HtpX